MAPDNPAREPGLQFASAAEQVPRLAGDLRQHRCADIALAARAPDKLTELVDAVAVAGNPLFDSAIDVATAAPAEELDAQLLEIAREAGRKQPLPLVGGNEAGDLLLRPVEAERFAEPGVGAGRFELVELLARRQRGDPEYAVELVQADEQADDVVAGAERDQPVASSGGFVLHFGADEPCGRRRDLAHAP